jgi:hypothetical protein
MKRGKQRRRAMGTMMETGENHTMRVLRALEENALLCEQCMCLLLLLRRRRRLIQ